MWAYKRRGLYPGGLISGIKKAFRSETRDRGGLISGRLIIGSIILFLGRWVYNRGGGGGLITGIYGIPGIPNH